jgi:hypothetical protein
MDTIQFPTELREFLHLLIENHVEYLLIGGYAVGYHGFPRATADMDIWVATNETNAGNIIAALEAFGFGGTGMTPDLFLGPDKITQMGNPPLRIEILTTISGLEFAEAYAMRVVDVVDGVPVSFISADHLKINKRASGRPKDLGDLDNLP